MSSDRAAAQPALDGTVAAAERDAVALFTASGTVQAALATDVASTPWTHRIVVGFLLIERALQLEGEASGCGDSWPAECGLVDLLRRAREEELRSLLTAGLGMGVTARAAAGFLTRLAGHAAAAAGDRHTAAAERWGGHVAAHHTTRARRRIGEV